MIIRESSTSNDIKLNYGLGQTSNRLFILKTQTKL